MLNQNDRDWYFIMGQTFLLCSRNLFKFDSAVYFHFISCLKKSYFLCVLHLWIFVLFLGTICRQTRYFFDPARGVSKMTIVLLIMEIWDVFVFGLNLNRLFYSVCYRWVKMSKVLNRSRLIFAHKSCCRSKDLSEWKTTKETSGIFFLAPRRVRHVREWDVTFLKIKFLFIFICCLFLMFLVIF
jgi:hypothetical protein